ncbi:hypothetical protein KBD45_07345 [Candidatus Dojkabacteria bacterium]|nr:hypothetical protein [Candidatus Dojkabacteria bacterium]
MKKYIGFIIILLWSFLIFFPSFNLKFLLIDDGQIVMNSRKVITAIRNQKADDLLKIVLEPNEGRVRPAYWISQAIVFSAGQYNVTALHVFRYLFLILTLLYLYLIMKRFNVDGHWIFVTSLLFVTNFQNFENFYRLGPTEVYLGIFYLIILYYLIRKNTNIFDGILVFLATLLGVFTKESFFLIFLPLSFVLFLKNLNLSIKIKSLFLMAMLFVFGISVFAIRSSYGEVQGYALHYVLNFGDLVSRLGQYLTQINHYQYPLLLISFVYLIYWLFKNYDRLFSKLELSEVFYLILWAEAVVQLVILLPWVFVLGRYLILVNISLSIVYAITLNMIWNEIKLKSKYNFEIKILAVILLSAFFMVRNYFPVANYQLWQKTDSDLTNSLIKSLSALPNGSTVFVNYIKGDSNIEIFLETKWHLEEFYNRSDIKFVYIDESNLCTKDKRYVLDRTSDRFIKKDKLNYKVLSKISDGSYIYSPLNYGAVLKSFVSRVKQDAWKNNYDFDWTIYEQSSKSCL